MRGVILHLHREVTQCCRVVNCRIVRQIFNRTHQMWTYNRLNWTVAWGLCHLVDQVGMLSFHIYIVSPLVHTFLVTLGCSKQDNLHVVHNSSSSYNRRNFCRSLLIFGSERWCKRFLNRNNKTGRKRTHISAYINVGTYFSCNALTYSLHCFHILFMM